MEKLMTNVQFNELVEKVKIMPTISSKEFAPAEPSSVDEVLGHLCNYWQIARPILKVTKLITPPKVDKAIDEILVIVGKLCSASTDNEKSELLEKFAMVWEPVKPILEAAKDITGRKVDQVIDEVIKIGDLLTKVPKGKMERPSFANE